MPRTCRIAYFALDVANSYNELLLKGVMDGARETGARLIVLHGGQYKSPHFFEAVRNALYELPHPSEYDAILIPDIFSFVEPSEIRQFFKNVPPKPIVCMSHRIDGFPSVMVDNRGGFRDLVEYLVRQGRTKFVAVTGPEHNMDSNARMETLRAVLHERRIEFSPERVYRGSFIHADGIAAVQHFCERRIEFDAVVCFNDNMAMSALEELQKRGYNVGTDVAVTGFDNTEDSQSLTIPITTVDLPVYQLAKTSFKLAVGAAQGSEPAPITLIPSRFIARRSTGIETKDHPWDQSLPAGFLPMQIGNDRIPFTTGLLIDALFEVYRRETQEVIDQAKHDRVLSVVKSLVHDAYQALSAPGPALVPERYFAPLEELFKIGGDPSPWSYLFQLMGNALYLYGPIEIKPKLTLWCSQAQFKLEDLRKLFILHSKIRDRHRINKTLEMGESLVTGLSLEHIYRELAKTLPGFDFHFFVVVLFVPGSQRRRAKVRFWLGRDRFDENEFDPRSILPGGIEELPVELMIDAIHVRSEWMGYIVYNLNERAGLLYKSIRHQLSTAVYTASLVREIHQINTELEQHIAERTHELEEANDKLKNEIEEHGRMAEALLHQKNLESIGLLAAGLAHDFNNLLTGIMGNVSLLELSDLNPQRVRPVLKDILGATNRAKELTRQLLTFSRGGAPMKQRAALPDLITETATFSLRGSQCLAFFDFPNDLWDVEIDRGQISQVIGNLALNAVQAMQSGGKIDFEAFNHVQETDSPDLASGEYVCISIKDEGAGMSPEILRKIFTPYFTTKSNGNGLGLVTSLNIVHRHQGQLRVESEIGKGTQFLLYLPRAQKSEQSPAAVRRPDKKTIGTRKVLIMDDDPMIRDLLSRLLVQLGHTCTSFVDGERAIEGFRTAAQARNPFEILILDLTVPGGMGGKEALHVLKSEYAGIRALASTGYSEKFDRSEFKKYGFQGFLSKPYTVDEVEAALADLFVAGST